MHQNVRSMYYVMYPPLHSTRNNINIPEVYCTFLSVQLQTKSFLSPSHVERNPCYVYIIAIISK
jgi:hypothetical protein